VSQDEKLSGFCANVVGATKLLIYMCLSVYLYVSVSLCVVVGRSGLAITLVTPFDIGLFQAVESHIGNWLLHSVQ